MSIIQIATITPQPDYRDVVGSALAACIARCHVEESGCEVYALHSSGDVFVVVEKWADADALAAHRTGAPMAELIGSIKDKLGAPLNVQVLEPIAAGTAPQGSL